MLLLLCECVVNLFAVSLIISLSLSLNSDINLTRNGRKPHRISKLAAKPNRWPLDQIQVTFECFIFCRKIVSNSKMNRRRPTTMLSSGKMESIFISVTQQHTAIDSGKRLHNWRPICTICVRLHHSQSSSSNDNLARERERDREIEVNSR